MKYKLLQNAPNANKGDIFDIDASSRFEYYTSRNASYHKDDVENNPKWFASFCFTTEDGVDIYQGESHYYVHNYGKGAVDIGTASLKYPMEFKTFSTRQAAEKYLEPKFKVGDYFVYDNEVHQIDNIKISSFISNEKSYDKALCRKANNEEIISYYEKLGWVKGASFKEKGQTHIRTIELIEYDACTNILWVIGGQYPNKIEECELVKYPKSWKELRGLKGGILSGYITTGEFYSRYTAVLELTEKSKFKTYKQSSSALAYAQLSQLIAEMNGDWQPNWNDDEEKYLIFRDGNILVRETWLKTYSPLAFKTEEARDFSFEFHKDLWKTYYQL